MFTLPTPMVGKVGPMAPTFDSIGKAAADFFKDKFDYKSQVQLQHRVSKDLTLTSTGGASAQGLFGSMRVRYGHSPAALLKAEVDAKSMEAKATLQTTTPAKHPEKGDAVFATATTLETRTNHPSVLAGRSDLHWSWPLLRFQAIRSEAGLSKTIFDETVYATGTAGLDASLFEFYRGKLGGVLGYRGLSIGGQVQVELAGPLVSEVHDHALGSELDLGHGATVSCRADHRAERVALSYFHKLSTMQNAAVVLTANPLHGTSEPVLMVGTERRVDETTQFKVKGELQLTRDVESAARGSRLAGVVEHRLTNPSLLFALSTSYQPQPRFTGLGLENVGVSLTFGDFDD